MSQYACIDYLTHCSVPTGFTLSHPTATFLCACPALDRYWIGLMMLWSIFNRQSLRAKNKLGIGLFIHAVKSGQKPSLTKPGCGWKEWADESIKLRLMQYSHSQDSDIIVQWRWLRVVKSATVIVVCGGGTYCYWRRAEMSDSAERRHRSNRT